MDRGRTDPNDGTATDHRKLPSSVKRERAGLLWALLPAAVRRHAARHLALEELRELNQGLRDYRDSAPTRRRHIELDLQRRTSSGHTPLPTIVSLGLALVGVLLLAVHFVRVPTMPAATRTVVFMPLLLGVLAPLSLYLVPRYRLRELFGVSLSAEAAATTMACFLGLVWMLYFIGAQHAAFGHRPGGWTLLVLTFGAVTAPLLEEVFFREFLPSLFGRPPHWGGHLLAAALFAGSHLPTSFGMFGLYLASGLFLAVARIQTGGLLYPFLIHSAANGVHQLWF